jgi:hypothetical protein
MMRLNKALLGVVALTAVVPAVQPASADTVVERTYYQTSSIPVRNKVTMYKTSYVPVTRRRVVYEKAMVPVRRKVTEYRTAYVPTRSRSVVRLASAPETTTIERKVVTTRTTDFIPTTTAVITNPSPVYVRSTELMPSSVVVSPTVIRTAPVITSAPDVLVPESTTVVIKEKHHKMEVGTLEPVLWY